MSLSDRIPDKNKTNGSTREFRESIDRTLDETRDNIRKSIDESRKNIYYIHTITEFQEESLDTAKEIAENYLDSQKEILNLLETTWIPFSPKNMAESYANIVSNFADNIISSTRSANNVLITNMDLCKPLFQQLKENSKETSRAGINSAKIFQQTYRKYYS